jgi:hypothetical protein
MIDERQGSRGDLRTAPLAACCGHRDYSLCSAYRAVRSRMRARVVMNERACNKRPRIRSRKTFTSVSEITDAVGIGRTSATVVVVRTLHDNYNDAQSDIVRKHGC